MRKLMLVCALSALGASACMGVGDESDLESEDLDSAEVVEACRVAPNPVGVGVDYTVSERSLPPNQRVRVLITDATGRRPRIDAQTDATGTATVTTQSSLAGTAVARFFLPNQTQAVARCSFRVGSDRTAPSVPTGLHTVTTTDSTISIAWIASTDDTAVRSYTVYRDGNVASHVPAASTSFTDTGVWPHSTHSYYVAAVDTSGNASGHSALITAYTLNDVAAPSQPANLTAQVHASPLSVSLSWGASTDDVRVDRYDVWRNIGGDLHVIGSTTETAYTDTTVPADARCEYFVTAVDEFSNQSNRSASAIVTSDITPPTVPADVRVTASSATSVSLAWTASSDNFSIDRYEVYRDGALVATVSWSSGTVLWNGTLTPGTTYAYQVVAIDPSGNASARSATVTATTTGG